ncbi:hypothetical protein DRP53_02270 [candidate division WOR-3 bacterium]|uniref:Uncharacterized protein n=1 Tax=candidate division WOR-3 bacterium TaxID=2052148 RepID=A0A660SK92_UNCW3|nr:MAG: hypothetical protein DRP53_02270 [candidate division WOR-3 bacterium]
MIEYYCGHRGRSYPILMKSGNLWLDVHLLESKLVQDISGTRKRIYICKIGDEIRTIEDEE